MLIILLIRGENVYSYVNKMVVLDMFFSKQSNIVRIMIYIFIIWKLIRTKDKSNFYKIITKTSRWNASFKCLNRLQLYSYLFILRLILFSLWKAVHILEREKRVKTNLFFLHLCWSIVSPKKESCLHTNLETHRQPSRALEYTSHIHWVPDVINVCWIWMSSFHSPNFWN